MAVETEKEVRDWANRWGEIMREIGPKVAEADKLKKRVFAWLKKNRRCVRITAAEAIAVRFEKFGDREISLTEFLEAASEKTEDERNACLSVSIKEAEKLLGKDAINKIAERPTVLSNSLELRPQE